VGYRSFAVRTCHMNRFEVFMGMSEIFIQL